MRRRSKAASASTRRCVVTTPAGVTAGSAGATAGRQTRGGRAPRRPASLAAGRSACAGSPVAPDRPAWRRPSRAGWSTGKSACVASGSSMAMSLTNASSVLTDWLYAWTRPSQNWSGSSALLRIVGLLRGTNWPIKGLCTIVSPVASLIPAKTPHGAGLRGQRHAVDEDACRAQAPSRPCRWAARGRRPWQSWDDGRWRRRCCGRRRGSGRRRAAGPVRRAGVSPSASSRPGLARSLLRGDDGLQQFVVRGRLRRAACDRFGSRRRHRRRRIRPARQSGCAARGRGRPRSRRASRPAWAAPRRES